MLILQAQGYCTLDRLQNSVTITYMHWGYQKNSRDSLYCNIHLIEVPWNQTHKIFKRCI